MDDPYRAFLARKIVRAPDRSFTGGRRFAGGRP